MGNWEKDTGKSAPRPIGKDVSDDNSVKVSYVNDGDSNRCPYDSKETKKK